MHALLASAAVKGWLAALLCWGLPVALGTVPVQYCSTNAELYEVRNCICVFAVTNKAAFSLGYRAALV